MPAPICLSRVMLAVTAMQTWHFTIMPGIDPWGLSQYEEYGLPGMKISIVKVRQLWELLQLYQPTIVALCSLIPTLQSTNTQSLCQSLQLHEQTTPITIGITNINPETTRSFFSTCNFIVRRAGLLWSQQDFEWRWSVPLFKCLTVLEFSFILFDLCLLITFFNFIMNYVPIVTFWIFTYHKIWILSIMFCFIWSYWIIYFLARLEVSWRVVS